MWIIKNRVTGEYDPKGLSSKFSKINRSGWGNLGHAKNHVAQKVKPFRLSLRNLNWYIDADFIRIDEDGTRDVIPVGQYLAEYLCDEALPVEEANRLKEYAK